jgi:hypothetical protein
VQYLLTISSYVNFLSHRTSCFQAHVMLSSLRLHQTPPIPRQRPPQRILREICRIGVHKLLSGLLRARGQRLLVAGEVVKHAVCNDHEVFGQVQRRSDDEEREDDEEDGICML